MTALQLFGAGNGSLSIVQNKVTAYWFDGKELALAFGCTLAFSRLGSVLNFLLSSHLEGRLGLAWPVRAQHRRRRGALSAGLPRQAAAGQGMPCSRRGRHSRRGSCTRSRSRPRRCASGTYCCLTAGTTSSSCQLWPSTTPCFHLSPMQRLRRTPHRQYALQA